MDATLSGDAEPAPPPLPPTEEKTEPSAARKGSARHLRVAELCLVQLVAFGPAAFSSVVGFINFWFAHGLSGQGTNYTDRTPMLVSANFTTDLQHLSALAVCSYVLFRQGRSFRALGLNWRSTDLFLGLGLAVLNRLFYSGVFTALREVGYGTALTRGLLHYRYGVVAGSSVAFHVAMSFYWLWHDAIVGLCEELIVRAYLMTEVTALTGNVSLAVFVSVLLQASYHLYQGWPSAAAHVAGFLVFALFYAGSWRATPIVLAHLLIDLFIALRQTWG